MSTRKKFYLAKSNQEGGTIENDFKEFSKYLMELIGATTDEELQNFVKEQGPEKVNEIYKQWKKQVPMAKDGMQFVNDWAVKAQRDLIPGNIAIRNKIKDTVVQNNDLRGISSFKEAFAEARRRGLEQFSWGKGSYTTELAKPTNKSTSEQVTKKSTEEKSVTPTNKKKESVNTVVEKKREDTNREVPDSLKGRDTSVQAGESNAAKPAAKPTGKGESNAAKTETATPTPTPTPLQPSYGLNTKPLWQALGAAATAGVVGLGTIYGKEKYDRYKRKQRAAARASAPSTSSAPKPSIFRNLGDNVKGYMSKVPFKEKVNEYTSKASSLFKRTPATTVSFGPPVSSGPTAALRAEAMTRTLTAPPASPLSAPTESTFRWGGWKYDAPAPKPASVATAPKPAPVVTAPTAPPVAPPAGSTARWEGWKYDATPKFEGTTPKPEVKPEVKPKAAAPKSGGKSGKSLRPKGTSTLAGKMAGRANMLGMVLGLISDLFPSEEAVALDRDAWEASKMFGIRREEVTRFDVDRYRRLKEMHKEGGKLNKLDYINRLNGECPEGYTAVKFAKGGVICTTCQKNKEVAAKKKNHLDAIKEEMKCGGKMKSHQKGGEMTKEQYRKASWKEKVDQDLRDQAAGKNDGEGGTPITDLAASKKATPKAAPKKLIKKPTKK